MSRLRPGPVALDTVCFIYFIEERAPYANLLQPLFDVVAAERRMAATSALTLLEVLVVPYRAGDIALAERYEALLTRSRGLRMVDLDYRQLRAAAQLRAVHPTLRIPDALQIAAAVSCGCGTLVTNDRRYPAVPGLRVLQLDAPE